MKTFDGIQALRAAVGEHLGHSDWHTVAQEQINQFAEATGDHQWIHVDLGKAADGPFATTIAHGFLTLSLQPLLTWQVYEVTGVSAGLKYGADKLRFPSPVPVGSKVRAGVDLLDVIPKTIGHQVATPVTIEREGGDKPVCAADMLAILVP